MGVWNSSRHTVQEMTPVLRARSLEQEEMRGLSERKGLCLWVTIPLTRRAGDRMEDSGGWGKPPPNRGRRGPAP